MPKSKIPMDENGRWVRVGPLSSSSLPRLAVINVGINKKIPIPCIWDSGMLVPDWKRMRYMFLKESKCVGYVTKPTHKGEMFKPQPLNLIQFKSYIRNIVSYKVHGGRTHFRNAYRWISHNDRRDHCSAQVNRSINLKRSELGVLGEIATAINMLIHGVNITLPNFEKDRRRKCDFHIIHGKSTQPISIPCEVKTQEEPKTEEDTKKGWLMQVLVKNDDNEYIMKCPIMDPLLRYCSEREYYHNASELMFTVIANRTNYHIRAGCVWGVPLYHVRLQYPHNKELQKQMYDKTANPNKLEFKLPMKIGIAKKQGIFRGMCYIKPESQTHNSELYRGITPWNHERKYVTLV